MNINAGLVSVALPCAVLSAATIGRDSLTVQSKVGKAKRAMMRTQAYAKEYVEAIRAGQKVKPEWARAYLEFMAHSKNLANAKLQGSKSMSLERDRTTINAVRAAGLAMRRVRAIVRSAAEAIVKSAAIAKSVAIVTAAIALTNPRAQVACSAISRRAESQE